MTGSVVEQLVPTPLELNSSSPEAAAFEAQRIGVASAVALLSGILMVRVSEDRTTPQTSSNNTVGEGGATTCRQGPFGTEPLSMGVGTVKCFVSSVMRSVGETLGGLSSQLWRSKWENLVFLSSPQLCMFGLRLGFLSTYLSEPIVKAFTSAAAFHVTISQLQSMLGLRLPRHTGPFSLFKVGV